MIRNATRRSFAHWWQAGLKIALSILGAGVSYSLWLAVFLLTMEWIAAPLRAVVWVLAPVVTAAGFTAGIAILERRAGGGLLRIFVWPLIGCMAGAGAVIWVGPMLIVFGMFGAGTASVVLREVMRPDG